MITIGLISDTHFSRDRPLNPNIKDFFSDVSLILHAGDIGDKNEFEKLQQIAPVIAVMGNKEQDKSLYTLNEYEIISQAGFKFYICHGLSHSVADYIEYFLGKFLKQKQLCSNLLITRLEKKIPKDTNIVLYGHTHFPQVLYKGKTLFINPGAAFGIKNRLASAVKIYVQENSNEAPVVIMRYFLT